MQKRILIISFLLFLSPLKCFSQDCGQKLVQAGHFYKMAQEQMSKNITASEKFLRKALMGIENCRIYDNTLKIKILISLGKIAGHAGNRKESIAFFEQASDLERNAEFPNSFTLVLLGDAYSGIPNTGARDLGKAMDAYQEALEINKFSSETLREKAKSNLNATKNRLSKFSK